MGVEPIIMSSGELESENAGGWNFDAKEKEKKNCDDYIVYARTILLYFFILIDMKTCGRIMKYELTRESCI